MFAPIYSGVLYHAVCLGPDVIWLPVLFDQQRLVPANFGGMLDNPGYFQCLLTHQRHESESTTRF